MNIFPLKLYYNKDIGRIIIVFHYKIRRNHKIFNSQLNPDLYHGWNKRKNFFEGWYFKIVEPETQQVFAFIPGIFMGKEEPQSHSFIQLVNGQTHDYRYKKFSTQDFNALRNKFEVKIADNLFSLEQLKLNIKDSAFSVKGQLYFKNILKWPDSKLNPGSMGFYNYIPRMQCYSQVCSMDMDVDGYLEVNNQQIEFKKGKGYVEKNWGKSFPYSWIWIQSNSFSSTGTSLSCSLAHIPLSFYHFRGFLIGLYVKGVFYSFTSINHSQINISKKQTDIDIRAENKKYLLNLKTKTERKHFILLNGPRGWEMIPLVQENLLGKVKVTLLQKKDNTILFDDEGYYTGIEYGGKQMLVLD